jgi:cytochrome b561
LRADGGASAGAAEIAAPPIVPKPSPMMTGFAHLGHLVIYLLFIALPLIGMVMMYWRGIPGTPLA